MNVSDPEAIRGSDIEAFLPPPMPPRSCLPWLHAHDISCNISPQHREYKTPLACRPCLAPVCSLSPNITYRHPTETSNMPAISRRSQPG